MAVLDLGNYTTEEGYYPVGDLGVLPQSQADCPPGTTFSRGNPTLPGSVNACTDSSLVMHAPTWWEQYRGEIGLGFVAVAVAAAGIVGYKAFKKRRVAAVGCGCE